MRFLGIGDTCDLGALYCRLIADGHAVRVSISEPLCHGILAGIVERVEEWRDQLGWVREAGPDGIILFENVAEGRGALQDELRRDGFNVIGGSAYGDKLEKDRAYGQAVLAGIGLETAGTWEFDDEAEALAHLAARPGRYVLKFSGGGYGAAANYVGRLADGRDVAAVMQARVRLHAADGKRPRFILMDHVEGVEMGVGAYFDGRRFLEPACLDWEHKRFFPGDLGELTGEMGTVVTYRRTKTFFERTLARMAPLLRENGYLGYININTVVNEEGVWPLEFTCRFGYPGFAILDPLQAVSWAELFRGMAAGDLRGLDTRPGFAVGIVMTSRPFPYIRTWVPEPIGLPILFDPELGPAERAHIHPGEMGLDEAGEWVTAGYHGWTMVVTGTGDTIPAAQAGALALADRTVIPNVRYRRDIGDKLVAGQWAEVERLGLLDPE